MIFAITISLIGQLVAHRTNQLINRNSFFTSRDVMIFEKIIFALTIFGFVFSFLCFRIALASTFVTICLPLCGETTFRWRRKRQLSDDEVLILDQTILSMKSGRSFLDSLRISARNLHERTQIYLSDVISTIELRQIPEKMRHDEIGFFLIRVAQNPGRQIDQIKSFRYRKKVEAEFRAKVRKALTQTRAQALVISIIYLLLLIFVIENFGFRKNSMTIFASAILMLCGVFSIYRMGRGYRWKI